MILLLSIQLKDPGTTCLHEQHRRQNQTYFRVFIGCRCCRNTSSFTSESHHGRVESKEQNECSLQHNFEISLHITSSILCMMRCPVDTCMFSATTCYNVRKGLDVLLPQTHCLNKNQLHISGFQCLYHLISVSFQSQLTIS